MTKILKHVQARVNDSVLERVSRLYSAALDDILNELLQNSRRANASRIELTVSEIAGQQFLTIADDGDGVTTPDLLLSLGESQWQKEAVRAEDPAGMGFFSLALRSVEVRSHDWCMQLQPKHFNGTESVPVTQIAPIQGTCLTFPISDSEAESVNNLNSEGKLKFFPLPVQVNGKLVEREDFLKDAIMQRGWNGLRLGVVSSPYKPSEHYWSRFGPSINFHGITIRQQLPYLELPPVNDTKCREYLGILIDVQSCADLKLVLPARKEVVQDAFWEKLKWVCQETLFMAVLAQPSHRLSFSDWQRAWSEFNIRLQPAIGVLRTFVPEPADHVNQLNTEAGELIFADEQGLLIDNQKFANTHQFMLQRAMELQGAVSRPLLAADANYEGYSWYDSLPRITAMSLVIQDGDSEENIPQDTSPLLKLDRMVDALFLDLEITGKGNKTSLRLPLDVAVIDDDYHDLCDAVIYATKGTKMTAYQLADWLQGPLFCSIDEGDTWDTQLREFERESNRRTTALLDDAETAAKNLIRDILQEYVIWNLPVAWNLPPNTKFDVTIQNRKIDVRVTQPESESAS